MMHPLTDNQSAVLKYIVRYSREKWWSPSHQEIADNTGIDYRQVDYILERLDEYNYIIYEGNRQIRVLCTE